MHLELKYGQGKIETLIPETFGINKVELSILESHEDILVVEDAFRKSDLNLDDSVSMDTTVALVISDYTRPTGTQIYLPILVEKLEKAGVRRENVTVVIALGLHRPAEKDEIIELVTEEIWKSVRVENHSADSNLTEIGGTRFNSTVVSADLVILTGSVTFHPMAGFSGGYKSLLPGVASREAIIENHRLYFDGKSPHPNVGPALLDNNPVQEDLSSRSRVFENLFCLNVVLGSDRKIDFASAGSVEHAWGACCDYLEANKKYELSRKYPLVIASAGGYPVDYSFYQCMKILTNSSRAALPGGKIIIVAECSYGWEIERELFGYFQLPMEVVARKLKADFRMDGLAVYMAMRVIRDFDIYFLTRLHEKEVEANGMKKIMSGEDLSGLLRNEDPETDLLIMGSATQVLPVFTDKY